MFNLRSPDASGAAGKLLVRQAVEYGMDKSAVVKAIGGPAVAQIINTVIPPGNVGYVNNNLYPDDNGQGNVAMCKSDLAKAGYPNGVTLTYMYPNDSSNTRIFTAIQASLANCGITLTGKPEPGSSFFTDLGNAPENNKAGQWDMGQPGWIPDWFGNNGRTVVQALFQGPNCVINTVNYGCYDNATVNSLITQAEGATSLSAAGNSWHQADVQIMSDAAIVPIMDQSFPHVLQRAGQGYRVQRRHVPDGDLRAEHRRSRHHRPLAGRQLSSDGSSMQVRPGTTVPGRACVAVSVILCDACRVSRIPHRGC